MLESTIDEVIEGLREAGITFCCHLPDSWMAPVIQRMESDPGLQVVPVVNEGEGVAMCGGAWLGGRGAVMVMENSGVREACEELARLGLGQGVPVFMLMPYRGDLGDEPYWAQPHGWTMRPVLEALRVSYRIIRRADEIRPVIRHTPATMRGSKNHVAVVLGAELCQAEV